MLVLKDGVSADCVGPPAETILTEISVTDQMTWATASGLVDSGTDWVTISTGGAAVTTGFFSTGLLKTCGDETCAGYTIVKASRDTSEVVITDVYSLQRAWGVLKKNLENKIFGYLH